MIAETIVISGEKKDLFRIHFYEDCIKFDIKFAEGIYKDKKICKKIVKLSDEWAKKKKNQYDVLEKIMILIEFNAKYFEEYYFKDYELNDEGKYIDLVPIDSLMIQMGEPTDVFYKYLQSEKALKEIDKKEFESNLKKEEYQDLYIDMYSDLKEKKIKYYQYRLNANFDRKICNIIASEDEKVIFGYVF